MKICFKCNNECLSEVVKQNFIHSRHISLIFSNVSQIFNFFSKIKSKVKLTKLPPKIPFKKQSKIIK